MRIINIQVSMINEWSINKYGNAINALSIEHCRLNFKAQKGAV